MRRRNLIGAGEMPYLLAGWSPAARRRIRECDSGDYGETLERCLAEFGWEEKRALQGRLIDGRYHGVAVACFIEGAGAGPKETARLDLERGRHSLGVCRLHRGRAGSRNDDSADRRRYARPAARPGPGVSRLHPLFSTRAMARSRRARRCSAARRCSRAPRPCSKNPCRRRRAAWRRRRPRSNWSTASPAPAMAARSPSPSWRRRSAGRRRLFSNNNRLTYSYGSAAAHVAVDPGTGHVELLDFLVVEDVGRIVNPLTLHGQAIGGDRAGPRRRLHGGPRL